MSENILILRAALGKLLNPGLEIIFHDMEGHGHRSGLNGTAGTWGSSYRGEVPGTAGTSGLVNTLGTTLSDFQALSPP